MLAKTKKEPTELVEKSFIHYLPIVIVGILICGVPSAILNSAAGIYYPVMAEDFGVPVSQISLWRTLDYITGVLFAPLAGHLFAKWNAKWVLLAAAAIESCVFILFGFSPEVWCLWIGGAIAGVTNVIMLGVGVATIMNRWFRVSVGLVIGVCTAFTGFGGMLFTPIGQMLIDTAGWRTSYITLGIVSLVVMVLGVLFLFSSRPEDRGLLPYGTKRAAEKAAVSEDYEVNPPCVRPKIAYKSAVFWILFIGGIFINTVCNMNAYFATYVNWYDSQADVVSGIMVGAFVTGAELTAFNSAGNAIGKLGLGFFSDLNLKATLFVLSACGVVGQLMMWLSPDTILLPIGSVLMGCFIPAVLVVFPMLTRACFGNGASYPVIWGYISTALGLGGACGSYFWGLIYESAGFTMVFSLGIVMILVVLVMRLVALGMKDKLPRERLTEADL